MPRARRAYEALSAASIGIEMGLAVFVGWWVGQWLDDRFGTAPYLMLFFLGCGVAAAFKAMWRVKQTLLRAHEQAKSAGAESEQAKATPGTAAPGGEGPA